MCSISLAKRTYIMLTVVITIIMALFGYCNATHTKKLLLKEQEQELRKIAAVLDQHIPNSVESVNRQAIGYSWANTTAESVNQAFRAALWRSVMIFFLTWAIIMIILRCAFQRIEQDLRKLSRQLREYGNDEIPQPGSFPEMADMLATVQELREEMRIKAKEIEKSERQFKTLVENCPYAIARYSRELRYLYVNPGFEKMCGVLSRDILGKNWRERGLPEEFYPMWEANYQKAFNTGENVEFDTPYITEQGIFYEYRICIIPEKDIDGRITTLLSISRDITEQKEAEERFAKAFHMNPSIMAITSVKDGTYIDVNDAFAKSVGLCREDIIGHSIDKIQLWQDEEEKQHIRWRSLQQDCLNNVEIAYRTHTNELRSALLTTALILVGGTECFLSVVTDITDQKKYEARLRDIVDQCPVGMIIVDEQGNVEAVNHALISSTPGRIWQEYSSQPYGKVTAHMGYAQADGFIHQALEQDIATVNQPLTVAGQDWIINVTPIYNDTLVGGAIAVFQDISDTVKLEREHLLALKRFEKLFRNNPAAMAVYKAADQTYIDVNAAWERMTGYNWDEVCGRNPVELEIVDPQDANAPARWHELAGEGVYHGEFYCKTKHGERRVAVGSVIVIDSSEERYYLATFVDVTDQQRMRDEVVRLAQLKALGEMAAGIAHEINQPLNSLQFVADAALYWYTQNQPPSQQSIIESMEIIRDQAKKIDVIIKNVRSIIQHGKLAQARKPVNINQVIIEVLQVLQNQLDDLTITVRTDLAEGLPPVYGTTVQIEEIVMNLVTNAMQALMNNQVKNRTIRLTTYFAEGVILTVADNGPGVSDEIADTIFDAFYTTRGHDGGLGMGLALARRIAELFHGSLDLVSTKQGATFRLKLIAYKEAERYYENFTC